MKQLKWILTTALLVVMTCLNGQDPANTYEEYQKNYAWRIRQTYLNEVYIPKDLTDAFVQLNKLIEDADKKAFKQATEEEVSKKLYFSLGRWIVVNWGFGAGSRLSHYIKGIGVNHPEDMAHFVIVSYHRSLNNKDLNVKEQVAFYKERRKEFLAKRNPEIQAILENNEKIKAEKAKKEN